MRLSGRPRKLFDAYARITAKAFIGDRLLSCQTLSKAPNYGGVLRRFLARAGHAPLKKKTMAAIAMRYCLTNTLHFLFLALARVIMAVLRWGLPSGLSPLADKNTPPALIIDTFAVLPKVAQDGRFDDLYMPGLFEEAEAAGKRPLRLYRLYGSRRPAHLWKTLRVLAKDGRGLTELHLFTLGDWWALFKHGATYPFALARLIRSLKSFGPSTPESYIRDALLHTAGQCILIGEARRLAGYRLGMLLAGRAPVGGRAPSIISWYENQTINKTFQRGLRQAENQTGRHVAVIGAQLFIWPDTLLNNHPDDGEHALGLTPDKVLVSGSYFLPEESQQPYAVCPSLRYKALFASTAEEPGTDASATKDGPLLVLLSYHPEETKRILTLALPLAEKGMPVVYKFHPATRQQDFTAWLPFRPVLAEGSLAEALSKAGAVLGAGSGSLAEAVAVGRMVLNVEVPGSLPGRSLNYLPSFGKGELWDTVQSAHDVLPALERLRSHLGDAGRADKVRQFRDLLFTEPTPERIKKDFSL